MVELSQLADARLDFVIILSGVVSLLTTLSVAARPAAILTKRVTMAMTIAQLFFMVTRFANLFYLPIFSSFVDAAVRTHNTDRLLGQILWVVVGSAIGAMLSWLLLPNFVSLFCFGVEQLDRHGSVFRVMKWGLRPSSWMQTLKAFAARARLGVKLFQLEGVEKGFLFFNVVATSIWTVGALCAIYISAELPHFSSTAVLLSGFVNSFAAIAFSIFVDPKAALITDQAIAGERPAHHVNIAAVHLAFGNFLGAALGLLVFYPGAALIRWATHALGSQGDDLAGSIWILVLLNLVFTLMASTTYASRVSAVVTRRVATALSIYNLFFLITRLAGQIYAPLLGSVSDHIVSKGPQHLGELQTIFRIILMGASLGALLGLLLLPTFVEIYNKAVRQLDKRGSIPAVFLAMLHPANWAGIFSCLRAPSFFGIKLTEVKEIPRSFLIGNVLVISIHTVGVLAAIYVGAEVEHLRRTATLLSSTVNGLATVTLSILVDPTIALITDRCVANERPQRHIFVTAVMLMLGMLIGTLLSQLVFTPATWVIKAAAHLIGLWHH